MSNWTPAIPDRAEFEALREVSRIEDSGFAVFLPSAQLELWTIIQHTWFEIFASLWAAFLFVSISILLPLAGFTPFNKESAELWVEVLCTMMLSSTTARMPAVFDIKMMKLRKRTVKIACMLSACMLSANWNQKTYGVSCFMPSVFLL